jgi:hypothetical protein
MKIDKTQTNQSPPGAPRPKHEHAEPSSTAPIDSAAQQAAKTIQLAIPLDDPPRQSTARWIDASRINFRITDRLTQETLVRTRAGLEQIGAKLKNGRAVANSDDAILFLIEQVAAADK